ncbi:thioredoxin reductase 2, mitochondrial-like [Watersipora subatra]|uniref:thioredoxin reductase 2, mitochondrial-like n=1 Tax=Watersipora subatra TaxID=2589382 RepID=UPI00355C69AC
MRYRGGLLYKTVWPSAFTRRLESRCYSSGGKYDLVVIGGGSGGLACAKEAADLGKKVAVLDYVDPSTQGTQWGLGGTCVNVGCIPKKLMHQSCIVGHHLRGSQAYGWNSVKADNTSHDWSVLVENVGNYIKSLNFGHRAALIDKNVDYIKAKGRLLNSHTVMTVKGKQRETLHADNIVIATGKRPRMLHEVEGMSEHAITSDDLFWMTKKPGKTLVVGGSYVALECAGILTGLGYDTSVMLRSIPLRGFDQQMARLVLEHMSINGTTVIEQATPQHVSRKADGRLCVSWQDAEDVYDTILVAVGRESRLVDTGVEELGVQLDNRSGCILGGFEGEAERTSVNNIYAIGDVLHGQPELTPVAVKAGKLLARRLFSASSLQMDYNLVPTTVFTPMEYSCVGLTEEDALAHHGTEAIEVHHAYYKPLEYALPEMSHQQCYIKVISMRKAPRLVLGIHHTGPNSGEIMQGFAVALRMGLTLSTLQSTIGIHPTTAEELVKLQITKRSGIDPHVTGC